MLLRLEEFKGKWLSDCFDSQQVPEVSYHYVMLIFKNLSKIVLDNQFVYWHFIARQIFAFKKHKLMISVWLFSLSITVMDVEMAMLPEISQQ